MDKIYRQVARALEDEILSGKLREEDMVPSTSQTAAQFQINPATAAKGVALLTQEGYLYKQRGIGLFVNEGARERILERRRNEFREGQLQQMLQEAHRVGISRRDLIAMIMAAP